MKEFLIPERGVPIEAWAAVEALNLLVAEINSLSESVERLEKKVEFIMENTDDGCECDSGCCPPTSLKDVYQSTQDL